MNNAALLRSSNKKTIRKIAKIVFIVVMGRVETRALKLDHFLNFAEARFRKSSKFYKLKKLNFCSEPTT